GAGGHPAHQVLLGAGLVVGAGGAAAAEGLLADDGAGGLVVDVEVAGREAELFAGGGRRGAVLGDDAAGEAVGRGGLHLLQHGVVVGVVVDVDAQDRAEVLVLEDLVLRVGGDQDRRADEVALGVVVGAAGHDLDGRVGLGAVDRRLVLGERAVVDDGAH